MTAQVLLCRKTHLYSANVTSRTFWNPTPVWTCSELQCLLSRKCHFLTLPEPPLDIVGQVNHLSLPWVHLLRMLPKVSAYWTGGQFFPSSLSQQCCLNYNLNMLISRKQVIKVKGLKKICFSPSEKRISFFISSCYLRMCVPQYAAFFVEQRKDRYVCRLQNKP